jgi:sugar-specific transcriptional regulator TrmB
MTIKDQLYFDVESNSRGSELFLENSSNVLSKFGLSPNQSKIYLCLNKMGPKTASQLSKTLDIPRTEVYHLLKTLQEKGCITLINKKPMKFGSVGIEVFLKQMINLEKTKIQKLEGMLFAIQKLKLADNFIANPQKIS